MISHLAVGQSHLTLIDLPAIVAWLLHVQQTNDKSTWISQLCVMAVLWDHCQQSLLLNTCYIRFIEQFTRVLQSSIAVSLWEKRKVKPKFVRGWQIPEQVHQLNDASGTGLCKLAACSSHNIYGHTSGNANCLTLNEHLWRIAASKRASS